MMKTRRMIGALSLAATAFAVPAQATAPQEIFTQLIAPAPSATLVPEARAKALPVLAYLPASTELVLAMKMPSILMQKESNAEVRSIATIGLSAGPGSMAALRELVSLVGSVERAQSLNLLDTWAETAKDEVAETIFKVYGEVQSQSNQAAMQAMQKLHIAPVYVVLTAKPGMEGEFDKLYRSLSEVLVSGAGEDSRKQAAEWQGFTGMCFNQDEVLREGIKKLFTDADTARAIQESLKGRKLYVLAKKQGDAILLAVCENTAELAWPASPEQSMLHSPLLNGADAHVDTLAATAWVSPELFSIYSLPVMRNAVLDATQRVFEVLSEQGGTDAEAFSRAAKGLALFNRIATPNIPEAKHPATLQVWKQQGDICIELAGDAMGGTYDPGDLQQIAQAEDSANVFYFECTPVNSPNCPKCDGIIDATYDVMSGVTLTLQEQQQDEMSSTLQMAALFRPDVLAVGAALGKMTAALSAPCSLVVSKGAMNTPSVALSCNVKSRADLILGWAQLMKAVETFGNKMGVQNVPAMLPIVPNPIDSSVMSYQLVLPIAPGVIPQALVSDNRLVLSTASDLGISCSKATQTMPFSGYVMSLQTQPIIDMVPDTPSNQKLIKSLKMIKAIYAAGTVQGDGISVSRCVIQCAEEQAQQ